MHVFASYLEKETQQGDQGGFWGAGCSRSDERKQIKMGWAHNQKIRKKITKTIYKSVPEGVRPIGSTRARRKDQVHKDMQIIGLQEEDARDIGGIGSVGDAKYVPAWEEIP